MGTLNGKKAADRIKSYSGDHTEIKIDRQHDVPYTGGVSEDGSTIYLDRHFPRSFKIGGKKVFTDQFLAIHELTEWNLMHHFGFKYQLAHRIATAAEAEAVHDHGVPVDEYYGVMYELISKKEVDRSLTKTPIDLDLKPYLDSEDHAVVRLLKRNGHRYWK